MRKESLTAELDQLSPAQGKVMITLNTEKGLVRIESWNDVLEMAGFTVDIDPEAAKLKSIIGSYAFKDFIKCGLASCHQPHGKGYLVELADGRVTNIGQDCGKTYFSVNFEEMRVVFDRETRAKERRETLVSLQHQLPAIEERIRLLKDTPFSGTWVHRLSQSLTGATTELPSEVTSLVKKLVRARSGRLTQQRVATKEERERLQASGQRLEKETYVEDLIGQLDGIAALYPENDLRELLVKKLRGELDELVLADVDQLDDRSLTRLAKWSEEIEPTLIKAAEVIGLGQRLFLQANIRQLMAYVPSRDGQKSMASFITQLPPGPMKAEAA
jgi:hypothetical protein